MHIRMQVRGSDKRRPQLAAILHVALRCTTVVATGSSRASKYEGRMGQPLRCLVPSQPFSAVQPYQTADRKEAQRLVPGRDPGVQSGVAAWWSAAHGGMDERRARPIIRGTVVLLLCAERGGLARASSLLAGDCPFFFFCILLHVFFSLDSSKSALL